MRRSRLIIAAFTAALLAASYALYVPERSVDELTRWQSDASRFVKVDSIPVHYRREGDPDKPTLVLLHGTSSSLHTWDGWVDKMRDQFDIVRLDIPGFGLTGPRADSDYSVARYVEFVNAFVDTLELGVFALAGNSLGGNIAWQYAAAYDDRLTALILIDASGFPIADRKPSLVFRMANWPIVNKAIPLVAPKSLYVRTLKEVYANDAKISPALVDRYYELSLRSGNRKAFVDRMRGHDTAPLSQLDQIKTPTLIQWGSQDAWIPAAHATLFNNALAESQMIIYEGVGHTPMEEAPDVTSDDAITFLHGAMPDLQSASQGTSP